MRNRRLSFLRGIACALALLNLLLAGCLDRCPSALAEDQPEGESATAAAEPTEQGESPGTEETAGSVASEAVEIILNTPGAELGPEFSNDLSDKVMAAAKDKAESQGVRGQVIWVEGNLMPQIVDEGEEPEARGVREPVARTLLFYRPVRMSEVEFVDGFFKGLPGVPVATVSSDEDGRFELELPEGTYSVFSKEPDGLWAGRFDGEGVVSPVEVKPGQFTEVQLRIDYEAAY